MEGLAGGNAVRSASTPVFDRAKYQTRYGSGRVTPALTVKKEAAACGSSDPAVTMHNSIDPVTSDSHHRRVSQIVLYSLGQTLFLIESKLIIFVRSN